MIRSMDAYDAIGGPVVPGHSIASMSSVEWMLNGAVAPVDTVPSLGRVLLLSASVGGGHTRAAEAVAAAIRKRALAGHLRHDRIEVVDTLAFAAGWFRTAYRGTYLGLLSKAPSLVGWLYERSDRPFRGVRSRWATAHASLGALRRLIDDFDPQTIISTHFLPSEYLAGLRRRGRLDATLMTVVTDIHVHGMWLADPCDHYFVATDQGRETLERSGVRRERITVSGIPIDPVFAQAPSTADGRRAVRTEARTRLGLPADRPVVLFTTGGACVGPIEALYRQLLTLKTPCELVAICGKSVSAREALERIAAQHVAQSPPGSAVRTQVLGHTTAMHDYMAAADLLIGKPGGLTSAEARASGLPMAIVHAIPGQEEHNATALTNAGCAVRCDTEALTTAVQTIDRLLQAPNERDAMAERALAGAAPRSADLVAMVVARHAQGRSRL